MNICDKIINLRNERGLTQEMIAEHFDIPVETIENWEKDSSSINMSDIPSIASFFNISIDELFDFDVKEIDNEVMEIVDETNKIKSSNIEKAEEELRKGLKKYPNNEVLLNNLLYVLPEDKTNEKIDIAKKLIQYTKDDSIKYDAIRILAKTYFELKDDSMVEYYLEQIPEVYFSKLELDALYLKGEAKEEVANLQLFLSVEQCIEMISCLIDISKENNNEEKAKQEYERAIRIIEAFGPVDKEYKVAYDHLIDNFKKHKNLKRF